MAPIPPDVSSFYTSPDIQEKQQAAQQAAGLASNYQSAAALLPMKLKQAIQEKLDYNKDIISEQNKKQAEYFAAPSQAREQYKNIFDPFQREALVSQATSQAYAPYATLTDILGQRQGNIADIVNAGTGAFQSDVISKQNTATQARQSYQDALSLAGLLAGAKQWQYEQETKSPAGGQGATLKQTMNDLADDARKGATLQQVMQAYGTEVDPSQILQIYNINSKYGPAKETPEELQTRFGIQPPVRTAVDQQTIDSYAQQVAKDPTYLSKVPTNIRNEVQVAAAQIRSQQSGPLGGITNWIQGLFQPGQ